MNPYLVVKKQPPKEKPPPKVTQITMIVKQPFKIMSPIRPIQQPRIKVSNIPNIVHIIEKPKKKDKSQKDNANPLPVHVLQSSRGRGYAKFTNIMQESDDEKVQEKEKISDEMKSNKEIKQQVNYKEEKLESKCKILDEQDNKQNEEEMIKVNKEEMIVIIETEQEIEETIPNGKKEKLFRKLQLPKQIKQESIALPEQSDFYEGGRESLKHKRALLVMKDKQGQMYHQQIVIPEQFEVKQENKPIINLKRNLKHQQEEPVNEKISSSVVNPYPIEKNLELYPIQQSYNPKQNKRTLFRNLQLPKQIKQESIALPEQSDFYEGGRESLKHKRALLVMKDKQGQMYHQQIVIPEQFEVKQENKPIINLKRNLKHQQEEPVNEKISSSVVNPYPIEKNLELYPIQQSYNPKQNKRTLFRNLQLPKQIKQESIALPEQSDFYEGGRESLKHKRALLVMKDKQGQMYHQQIVIPEQFEVKQENKPIINLKRNLKHQQEEPVNEKISSSVVNPYPIEKNLELYPIQQSYNPKQNKRTLFRNLQLPKQIKQESIALPEQSDFYEGGRESLKHKRALLVMKDKQGQMYHQQIVIPEQFEVKQENKPIINLKRNLKHQQEEPVNEKISSSVVNPYPIEKNLELYPIQQSYNPKQNKRTLFRNLQLPKQIKQESIALPEQSDFYEGGRESLKHKRALLVMKDKQGQMYHQQIVIPEQFEVKQENKPIINLKRNLKHQQEEPVNEKISSSVVNPYPIEKNLELYPIQQSYNPKQNKRTLFRNLQLPKQIKQESIALPEQSDFYEGGRESLKHKRALLVMKDKQGQMYHQQIVIPEQFEVKQENKPIINLKRNLKHQQEEPVNEKISSSVVNPYPIEKNLELYPIQQSYNPKQNKRTLFRNLQLPKQIKQESIALPEQSDFYEGGRESLKHKRALLVMKDKQGQMYHQQIVIPEQFEVKQENKPIINLKRNLKHQQEEPVNEKISSSVVNPYPIEKNLELYPIQQSYNPKQNKRTLFRNLQLPKQIKQESIALPEQSDFYEGGRESLKHKRALLVMKDKQGQMYHQQIVIPEQFEVKQENKPIINLKRNLKHQQEEPVNEKISSSVVNPYPIEKNLELYPIQQSYNPKQNKRTLFRNLQLPKQIKQESIALPEQSDFYEGGRESLKHKRALLVMKDKQGQMYHQQIVIPEQFEVKQENKPIINLKRNLKHQQEEPVNEKISSSVVNPYPIEKNLELYPIQQSYNPKQNKRTLFRNLQLPKQIKQESIALPEQSDFYEGGRESLKHKRALLVMKDKQGQMYHQQIVIPEQFEVKQENKPIINLKRNLKHQQEEPVNEKISSSVVNPYPIEKNLELYPIQQSYNPKQNKRTLFRNLQLPKQIKQESIALPEQSDFYEGGRESLKHKRALLVMKDKQGQMYHQQIVIPEQFEVKQENKPIINLKRNLKHQQEEPVNEKISSSVVNPYPIEKNLELYPIQQSYNPKQNKRTLFRNLQLPKQIKQESIALPEQSDFYEGGRESLKHKRALLVMKDKQGQMYHQQIVIPEQFEVKQENKPIINLKRNLKHQQEEPVNEKISSSVVNPYPIEKNLELYPIQQSYNPKQNKRTLFRNLQLPKQIKQESIALPEQSDFYEGGRESLKHKRALLVMKDKQGQMYHQQIVIPEQFEVKQENKPIINLKRNLKHQQEEPVNEKISSSVVNPYTQPNFEYQVHQPYIVNNSLNPDKSFAPSTLNSSLPQNPILQISSSDQQYLQHPQNLKLKRSLQPQRPIPDNPLTYSLSNPKIFNVYNPKSFLSDTNSVTSSSSLQAPTNSRPPKPHRRPGFYS